MHIMPDLIIHKVHNSSLSSAFGKFLRQICLPQMLVHKTIRKQFPWKKKVTVKLTIYHINFLNTIFSPHNTTWQLKYALPNSFTLSNLPSCSKTNNIKMCLYFSVKKSTENSRCPAREYYVNTPFLIVTVQNKQPAEDLRRCSHPNVTIRA